MENPDLEKTIKGLEICIENIDKVECPEECPYYEKCTAYDNRYALQPILRDTLALLKAQEPRVMTLEEVLKWATTPEEKRDPIFLEQKEEKGPNSWICNSVCPKDYYLCCLDKNARFWTSRPSDSERRNTPWE